MRYLIFFLLWPTLALAQPMSPTDFIRTNVDAVVEILTDPDHSGEEVSPEQMEKFSAMADDLFNVPELSKRALGQYWRVFNQEQRTQFQDLFVQLLKAVYMKRSITYNNEQVLFDQEIIKSETLAEVHTTLTSPELHVPIIYYLTNKSGSWKVYDIAVENVSLVKNYRSQFQSILQNKSPDELLVILEERIHKEKNNDQEG